ncbi:MAG TPA: hypothetical protein VF604_14585 [Pyrinomonadaceae bacterium]|jgi:hypothetical protein
MPGQAIKFLFFAAVLILPALFVQGQRSVNGKTLISDDLPKIKIRLKGNFKYAGKFDFKLGETAAGERYVFVDAKKKRIQRIFVAQFEGFLPGVKKTYNYKFDNALKFGAHKFRQNTYAYSNEEDRRTKPGNEGVLMAAFLREKGYTFEDEFMMSRFVTVPDVERRHELILFYIENAGTTGHRLSEFYNGDDETEVWRKISVGLTERSLKAFEIE